MFVVAWYPDESKCDYFGDDAAEGLRAVGWLEHEKEYARGTVPAEVYDRLVELLKDPWQPWMFMGMYACDLCLYEPHTMRGNNLFVPSNEFLYVAPQGITHYMNAHEYAPPAEFCQAILDCPDMRTMEYRRAISANGGGALLKKADPG